MLLAATRHKECGKQGRARQCIGDSHEFGLKQRGILQHDAGGVSTRRAILPAPAAMALGQSCKYWQAAPAGGRDLSPAAMPPAGV